MLRIRMQGNSNMNRREVRKLKGWIFLYVGLVVATVFIASTGSAASQDTVSVSPVAISDDAPALTINSLVRRSDI